MAVWDNLSADEILGPKAPPASTPSLTPAAPSSKKYSFDALSPDEILGVKRSPEEEAAKTQALLEASLSDGTAPQRKRLSETISRMTGEYVAPALVEPVADARRARFLEADHATRASPRTSAFFSAQQNADIALQDAKTLAQIETVLDGIPNFARNVVKGAGPTAAQGFWGAVAAPFELADLGMRKVGVPEYMLQRTVGKGFRAMSEAAATAGKNMEIPEPQGWLERDIMSGAESLGTNLAVLPAGVLMRSAEAALLLMSGISGGQSYLKASKEGTDPLRGLALGLPDATWEYATEKLGLKALFDSKAFKEGFAKQVAKFGLLEMGGEQIATIAQDFNEWMVLNPGKTLDTFLAERPEAARSTAIATLIGAGGQVAVVRGIETALKLAAEETTAQQQADNLGQVFQLAAETLIHKESPSTLDAFFAQVAPDSTVFFAPERLREILETSKIDPAKLPSLANQLDEATNVGPGVEVSVGELVSAFAGTSAVPEVIQHARFGITGESLAEHGEKATAAKDMLLAEFQRLTEEANTGIEFATAAQQAEERTLAELSAISPMTTTQNQSAAKLTAAYYATMASKFKITPTQFMDGGWQLGGKTMPPMKINFPGAPAVAGQEALPQPPKRTILNVGLSTAEVSGGGAITEADVVAAVQALGGVVKSVNVHQSDTEQTAVLVLEKPLDKAALDSLSTQMRQEAIVQSDSGETGELYGPKAADWGPFNREYFVMPEGNRASELFQAQSSRRPTTKKNPEDHLGEVPLTVDYTKIEEEKDVQNMALVAKYPGLRFKARTTGKRVEEFIQHVTDNLLWLHDQIPADIRQRSKLWYDGAREIVDRWTGKYGLSDAQLAAVLAIYSPQKDWFMNVSLAERTLDIVKNHQDTAWSDDMSDVADTILADEKFALAREAIRGKKLGELTDKLEQAMWVRVFDESHNDRGHRVVTPEGGFGDFAQTVKGANVKTGWPGFSTVIKALYVIEDGSAKMIDTAIGGEHKVRSFYNNIFHPTSDLGFVTIDTHAVAAGLLRPLSGNSLEVTHNFGGAGAAQSAATGMSGTYAYYQEAYRRAAEARGLLPREMQSITWEAVRELYTMGFKHDKAKMAAIDKLWSEYEKGKRELESVRAEILTLAGGVEQPSWVGHDSGISPEGWASSYTGELLGDRVSGRPAGRVDAGTGATSATAVPAELYQASRDAARVAGPVVGIHFSQQPRAALSSSAFGTGLTGAERERLATATDDRIKQRVAFYVSNGQGVFPEAGVGAQAHVASLENLYDADADALKIWRNAKGDMNAAESAVLDAGYSGYLSRNNMTNMGTVVMLGRQTVPVEHVGGLTEANARAAVPPSAEIPAAKAKAIELMSRKDLPSGQMTKADWAQLFQKLGIEVDLSSLEDGKSYYKDQVAGTLWQANQNWYYSQLARAVDNAPAKVFSTGKQVSAWLQSNAAKLGVKKDEIQWSGITDWLEMQGKVTKDDVAEFLRAGGVQVETTTLGDGTPTWFVREFGRVLARGFTTEQDAIDWADENAGPQAKVVENDERAGEAKFGGYIPPGGIDGTYRETLLTLPEKVTEARKEWRSVRLGVPRLHATEEEARRAAGPNGTVERSLAARYADDHLNFRSSHWDQPNVLVHLRHDEVTGADGKRYMRVIEVQSDWGQKGKKQGFDEGLVTGEVFQQDSGDWGVRWADGNFSGGYSREAAERVAADGARVKSNVPPAPFVTDTKSWVALGIKKAISIAAESGVDGIVFATGQQNADLYDLSKQISEVWVAANRDGNLVVELREKDAAFERRLPGVFTRSNLDEAIGKDAAIKAVEQLDAKGSAHLTGLDLKVGGEGMRAFYDQIVPQVANDVLKKLGAGVKVGEVAVATEKTKARAAENRIRRQTGEPLVDEETLTQPGFPITPELRATAQAGVPLFQPQAQDNKGAFTPATLDMRFLAEGDFSTFVHELSHYFLTIQGQLAAVEGAPQQIVDDMNAILKHVGFSGTIADWNAASLEQQRDYHEAFARSGEQYFFEGKAPSQELQGIFNSFAKWLKQIYLSIKNFIQQNPETKLNPELAAVFDRMLATDAEIEALRARRNYQQLFKDAADAGMTEKQFAEYTALDLNAKADADSMLRARSLRDLRWTQNARSKIIAEMQKENRELRNEMRKEVEADLTATPLRRAIRWLKSGEMTQEDGTELKVTEGHRLQISEVTLLFPEGGLVPPPDWRKGLGYGKYGMLAEEGLAPDLVAEMFGFTSGEAMVREILAAPPLKEAIEAETDARMLDKYGDINSPDALARAADEAIHNDARARSVATELWSLNKNIGSVAQIMKAAREYATALIEKKTSKTLKPWAYAAAEAKAGKAALEALRKGDREEAAKQKRTEILNHEAAKRAYAAEKEIKAIVDRFKKIAGYKDDSSAIKTRDAGMVSAVRAVLAEFDVGTKGKAAREYIDLVKQYDPALGEVLSEIVDGVAGNAKDWRQLTLVELRDLSEVVESVWYLAKRSRQIEIDGQLVARKEIENQLHGRLEEIGIPDRVPGEGSAVTPAEKNRMRFDTFLASLRRVESWVGSLDGVAMGPFRKYIWTPVREAADRYRVQKAAAFKRYEALLQQVAPSLERRLIEAPELGYTFGKAEGGMGKVELLHAILHTGNKSNLRKLLLGRPGWGAERGDGTLDSSKWDRFVVRMINEGVLTKADFDFAQGVWDLLEEMKPAAQKAHKAVFGRFFDEVTADSFTNQFGTYRGGYVPATVDSASVTDAALRELANTENENLAYAFPATAKGFTKKRVEYNRPLLLDLRTLTGHIDKVLLFANLTVPVNDVRRVIGSKAVSGALSRVQPQALGAIVTPWLNRAAKQTVETKIPGRELTGRFWTAVRTRTGMAAMFANVANAVQQVTGLSLAAVKVPPKHLARAAVEFATSPVKLTDFIAERSDYMKTRLENEVSMASDHINEILLNPSVYESGKNWARKHAYFLQSTVDAAVAPIVWLGAYNSALESAPAGLDQEALEKYAGRLADSAVRETQGSTVPEDVAAFETGSAFYRMFTQFAGYFNMNANLLGNEYVKITRDMGLRQGAGRGLYVLTFGLLAPALVGELIMQLFKGGPDDDDGDGVLYDDWLAAIFGYGLARYVTAMIPVAGMPINAFVNLQNNKPYDDRISTAPAVSMVESAVKAPQSVYKAIFEDGKPSRAVKDVATLLSLTTGLPVSGAVRPVAYLSDVAANKVRPTSELDMARGTITGAASPRSKQ